ncbi:Putative ribonuclease H protein At1g65750, partial [Linum perenne]
IAWKAAAALGFTLNTDGLVISSIGEASVGGCLGDGDGRMVDVFVANLSKCSITRADIIGVAMGLERAWEKGIRSVEVQTDSTCAINLLSEKGTSSNQHVATVGRSRRMLRRDWNVIFKHVYREVMTLDLK